MKGYFKNPIATDNTIRDGWLYTGDLGYIDNEGFLYITGHCKDVIVPASGKNIYPVELETLYRNHPAIAEICVIGLPYQDGSDTDIHAIIVPKMNSESVEVEIQEHLQKIAKCLPSYQHFHKSHFLYDALPKTDDNKFDRKRVKELLLKHLADDEISSEHSAETEPNNVIPEEILTRLAHLARMPTHKIHLESHLETDLGLDSLTRLDLLMLLEARIGQTIPDGILANLQTVKDVIELLQTFDATSEHANVDADMPLILRREPHWYARMLRAGIRSLYQLMFSFKVFGLENIPKDKPYIITPNHTSHLDTLTVITALGKESHRLWTLAARDYWFGKRIQAWFAHNCLNALPIERDGNFAQFMKDLRMANSVLQQNNGVLIYPEGTRSIDGKLQPFKPGILSLLVYGQQVPIIPTYIQGAYDVLPKGQNIPKKHPIRIVFGEPLIFDVNREHGEIVDNVEKYKMFLTELENRVAKLQETLT